MRMFQSSSRHSSEQTAAHNSSQPTASQLKGVSDTISNGFENHRPQRTQISTVTNAPFRSKLESNDLQVDCKFSDRIFQLLQYSRRSSKLFGSLGWSDDKNWLDFSIIFFKNNVDFEVQFFLRCKFSFHEKQHSSHVWQWRDLPKPI